MAVQNIDPGLQLVLDNIQTIVASEGGSVELLDLRDGKTHGGLQQGTQ